VPPIEEGIDIEAIETRHKVTGGLNREDPYCGTCGQTWPCDAVLLLGVIIQNLSGGGARHFWRGTCGHEWRIDTDRGRLDSVRPCPVCRVRKVAAEMAVVVLELT
jgi:hypothetical protein